MKNKFEQVLRDYRQLILGNTVQLIKLIDNYKTISDIAGYPQDSIVTNQEELQAFLNAIAYEHICDTEPGIDNLDEEKSFEEKSRKVDVLLQMLGLN